MQTEEREMAKVYQAINLISAGLNKDGIAKSRKNQQQGYSFRGIDDIYNSLSGLLVTHNLCILPEVIERTKEERETKSGGVLFYVTVKVKFSFIHTEDCSKHEIVTYGEAMDSADKATNKAMSAAYKYAAMMTFCIPTEGDNDTETHDHQVKPNAELAALSKKLAENVSKADSLEKLAEIQKTEAALFERLKTEKPDWHDKLAATIAARQLALMPKTTGKVA
jgi:hypothetical protein